MARKSVETFSRKNNENKTGGAKKSMKKLGKKHAKKSMKKRKMGKKLKGGYYPDENTLYSQPNHPVLYCKKEDTISLDVKEEVENIIESNQYFITVSKKSNSNECIYTINIKISDGRILRINFTESDDGKIIDINNTKYNSHQDLILKTLVDNKIIQFNQFIPTPIIFSQ